MKIMLITIDIAASSKTNHFSVLDVQTGPPSENHEKLIGFSLNLTEFSKIDSPSTIYRSDGKRIEPRTMTMPPFLIPVFSF